MTVVIPEWKNEDGSPLELTLRAMSAQDKDKWETNLSGKNGQFNLENIRARLAAMSIVDEKGELVFSDSDLMALGKKSGAAMARIYEAAEKLNYMSKDDLEKLSKN